MFGVHAQCITGAPEALSNVAGSGTVEGWIDVEIVMGTIMIVTEVIIKIIEL